MNVLISGGAGMIGSHVAELLLERGDKVMVVDNFETGRKDNLLKHKSLTLVEDTIADRNLVFKLFAEFKPDVVVHAACSYKDPDDWYNANLTNVVGGGNLLDAALQNKVVRYIYYQTALMYGLKPTEQPITLNHHTNPGNSSYAISKTAHEQYIQLSGIDFVSFRLANVIGPRNVSGPLPIFYNRLSQGKQCFVTESRRDFVFVKDLVAQTVRAVDGVGFGSYHFSSGTDVAIKELYDELVRAMGIETYPEPDVRPLGPDDAFSILLDPDKTFADFGEIEFTKIHEIADAAVSYYNKHGVEGGYTHLKHED